MDNEFIAFSVQMQEIKRLISLVKGIHVNTIILGDIGVGKSTVAKQISANAIVVDANRPEEVIKAIKSFDEIIIENFEKLSNADILLSDGKKIIATSSKKIKESILDRIFGVKINIPPLSEREEDIWPLTEHFLTKAKSELMIDSSLDASAVKKDIEQNCHSLKKAAYASLLFSSIEKEELLFLMEEYFLEHLDEFEENYKPFLDLFDSAVIMANYKKHKSQLMMSYKMGINRNTLRKKILGLELKLSNE